MSATGTLPIDIRLMNGVALAVYAIAALTLLVAATLWVMRSPAFPLRAIRIEGDLQRNSLSTVRANALPKLAGNFFSADLQRARDAFEAVPWVRQAVVRRVWPDRLAVRLLEHRPAAVWIGEDGNERLVNSFGEVFEANVGAVEDDNLPELAGPDGASAQMLAMMQRLQPVFVRMKRELRQLSLSGRGSWRAELEGEVIVELGRGSEDEVVARTERFVRTLAEVTRHYRSPLLAADLRHADGYAVRLRGVSTMVAASAPAAKDN
jgi:cell division protein FtsQ